MLSKTIFIGNCDKTTFRIYKSSQTKSVLESRAKSYKNIVKKKCCPKLIIQPNISCIKIP